MKVTLYLHNVEFDFDMAKEDFELLEQSILQEKPTSITSPDSKLTLGSEVIQYCTAWAREND